MIESALYIVPTPIGNLSDITFRAVEVLKAATLIAAEDTRHSRILLDKLGIGSVKMISCNDHNEAERTEIIAKETESGGIVALISDAGTPMISDPGYKLVSSLVERGVKVFPLPGPCAAITALCASAMPTDRFFFSGFLPVKDKELTDKLESIRTAPYPVVFYESPRRIINTLNKIALMDADRKVALCREMTKTFETIYRMKVTDLIEHFKAHEDEIRGEFVLIVGPYEAKDDGDEISAKAKAALEKMISSLKVKEACQIVSDLTGESKNRLYDYALTLKDRS
ncbi:MAG: 16S rRNA (cytidine(1402)-2'-O)-methyltransferase [Anaerobiospirillum succiniciproducens]|uniref:16S rRNA (cytidine(1402)-2'-O)-methyltransferase n=1 Tax=Anaerobiospirillum succiniciproducens TaxID=13335 RepID=UPI00235484E8|nr:16S rRNA (cytidine(1402)-2'-O)-methyltransferase [Anaerobiospirillum succiniciproducens]MCI6863965.1 16S rRNA (cytidine(1402)-2'-O)-methyltransferase [Anaerobiospirillum succiniciproducens]MDY2799069.1 16S rRNA (cytidine(1402)-2'-O)-methyltransferase [Anaerobiospirillum succiniciproducens]